MNNDRELMQQALDALQEYVAVVVSVNDPNDWTPKVADAGEPARKAIEALRARLAQPEKKWVGLTDDEYELMAEKRVTNYFFNTLDYAHAIEAKLKEKNT